MPVLIVHSLFCFRCSHAEANAVCAAEGNRCFHWRGPPVNAETGAFLESIQILIMFNQMEQARRLMGVLATEGEF